MSFLDWTEQQEDKQRTVKPMCGSRLFLAIDSAAGTVGNVVAQNKKSGRWECSCPGWIFHGHNDCKHLKAMRAALESVSDLKQIEEAR